MLIEKELDCGLLDLLLCKNKWENSAISRRLIKVHIILRERDSESVAAVETKPLGVLATDSKNI